MGNADRDKWDARHAVADEPAEAPSWLDELDAELPREGRALDVAAGRGRIALWAARRWLDVTAADISPVGLERAREAASREGLTLRTQALDLEEEPLPDGPFAWISCFHYRQPALWPAMIARLAVGGVLVAEIATVQNLERHAHPSRRFLAEPNELLRAASDLHVVHYREGWEDDRCTARLVAKRAG